MNNYENYVKEINNIFSIIEKIKINWNDVDNLKYVEEVNLFKEDIIKYASIIESKDENK